MPRGRHRGRRKKTDTAAVSESSDTSRELGDDQVDFDPNRLSLLVDGQWKSFSEWTLEDAHRYYPEVGRKTYKVPPVDFNTQFLKDDIPLDFSELKSPKEETRKKDRSQADIGRRLEELGQYLEQQQNTDAAETAASRGEPKSTPERGRGLFIVSNAHYDNYLSSLKKLPIKGSKLPPFPKEVVSRGELDFLVLHTHQGILLVQVKGVGFVDSWTPTQTELQGAVRRKVKEAQAQLTRDEVVLQHIMADLQLTCDLHRVVALPFVSQSLLAASLSEEDMDEEDSEKGGQGQKTVYLCAEQVQSVKDMHLWWSTHIVRQGSLPLSDFQLQSIVGRYCGLLSTVSVWCRSSLRMEVRDVAEAVVEMGNRFAHLVLTVEQRQALDSPHPFLFLHGPPGTGKSVMLLIKARHWLSQGHNVLILNLDFGRPGNPVGHYIHDGIRQWLSKTFHCKRNDATASPGPGMASIRKGTSSPAGLGKHAQNLKNLHSSDDSAVCSDSAVPFPTRKPEVQKEQCGSPIKKKSLLEKECDGGCPDTVGKVSAESMASQREPSDASVTESETGRRTSSTSTAGSTMERQTSNAGSDTTSSCCSASLSSGSDMENTQHSNHGQVFRIDFDLSMNGEEGKGKVDGLLQLIERTVIPGVPCHFIIDEFYWRERLQPVVEGIKQRFTGSCIWCAEVNGDVPPGFKPFMLTSVLRCPPSVQVGVLKFM